MKKSSGKAPWTKKSLKKSGKTKLTPASKQKAKATARKAGRPYPNLVDNMQAAKSQKKTTTAKKTGSKRPAAKKSTVKKRSSPKS